MTIEYKKHKIALFQFCGFSLMTPFARIVLQPKVVASEFDSIGFYIYLLFTIVLLIYGGHIVGISLSLIEELKKEEENVYFK